MINNVNFTGLKNIGGMANIEINVDPRNMATYLRPIERRYLIAKLTNDKSGNDLDKFNLALAQCTPDLDGFEFVHDKTYINIFSEKLHKSNDKPKIFLNLAELPLKRNTVPMFEFLAKLTRKIAKMPDSEYIYDNNFVLKDSADLFIMGDMRISEMCKEQTESLDKLLDIYSPDISRRVAKSVNNSIQERMIDYLM